MMCDALAANIQQGIADDLYILCFFLVLWWCLIGNIYDNEAHTKDYSPEKRLAYHQEKSTPIMEELKAYLEEQKQEFEPNSTPGKAIDYILNWWTELSQFLGQVHAPLDSNIVERALKLVIQVKKSSMFYKTLSNVWKQSLVVLFEKSSLPILKNIIGNLYCGLLPTIVHPSISSNNIFRNKNHQNNIRSRALGGELRLH